MDRDYFRNGDVPLSQSETAMEVPWTGPNCSSELPYLNPNSSFDLHYSQYESSLSSIVSSPVAPSSALCDLIGKFGGSGTVDARHSNFGNPVSLPKVQFSIVDPRNPNLGDPASLPPPLPQLAAIAADPAFIERAAKFSCFGSRCFNGRTSSIGDGSDSQPFTAARDAKLPRVSSSPALKPPNGSPLQNRNSGQNLAEIKPATAEPDRKSGKSPGSTANSNEESSVSDQIETATEANSRKRKGRSRGKPKEEGSASVVSEDGNAKESKPTESAKTEPNNEESEKLKADKKPLEPPKDYIHVRARRGQATDSHSLAERVRREKISERMKLLQDLVPGCNKITGKALMLDEIINYVQSLQHQVEFLSMKLASVNPSLDFNMENLLSRDAFQQHHNTSLPQPQMYPLDASANVYRQNVQQELHDANVSRGALVDPSTRHFPHRLDGFSENLPQFPGFTEDDLHSIVQMGFVHNSVNFPDMKVER